tara:strand:- start:1118 stop:1306 length:189 start_codon:yes stop_codon:yes gene_type:complete
MGHWGGIKGGANKQHYPNETHQSVSQREYKAEQQKNKTENCQKISGAKGNRTPDLFNAIEAL